MSHLAPCPTCSRHVRNTEDVCPFCRSGVSIADLPERPPAPHRMGRAAMVAFGAAFAFTAACGGSEPAAVYGGPPNEEMTPPPVAGEAEAESGEAEAPGADEPASEPDEPRPEDPPPVPVYGGPPPPD